MQKGKKREQKGKKKENNTKRDASIFKISDSYI